MSAFDRLMFRAKYAMERPAWDRFRLGLSWRLQSAALDDLDPEHVLPRHPPLMRWAVIVPGRPWSTT